MLFALLLVAFIVCLVGVSVKRKNDAGPVKRRARPMEIPRNPIRPKRRAHPLPSVGGQG